MWLYIPASTSSPSAPEAADSISASNWQFQVLAQSVVSRGKHSPSRIWFQRWKRVSWLQHLFGAMPEPSTAILGVAQWTASLAASRAKAIPLPERSGAASTSATSGRQPAASLSSPARGSSSSKTSPACSRPGMTKSLEPTGFGETFASWASRLREDCSQRQRSARATSVLASSSSRWPTPDASVMNDGETPETFFARREEVKTTANNGNGMGTPLTVAATSWPTPTANDWKGSGPTLERKDGLMRGDRLDYATEQLWSTPRASDGEKGGPNQSFGAGGIPLPAPTMQWITPRANENDESPESFQARRMRMTPADRPGETGTLTLQAKAFEASAWPTPSARDWKGANDELHDRGTKGAPLNEIAKVWATPSVADTTGGRMSRSGDRADEPLLKGQAAALSNQWPTPTSLNFDESHQPGNSRSYNETMRLASILPDLPISTDGEESSHIRRSLNPLFVEWLMGWPSGWTLLGLMPPVSTDFACSETALYLFKQRMRFALSQLALPREAPPAQLALFG